MKIAQVNQSMLVYRLFREVSLHSSGGVIYGFSTAFIQSLAGLCCPNRPAYGQ